MFKVKTETFNYANFYLDGEITRYSTGPCGEFCYLDMCMRYELK